jgi:peptide/nickel transport system ATP-binding protein
MTVLDETEEAGCTVSDLRVALTGRNIDVVDEINLELRPGEVVGLVGESGSGKTTAGTALLAYARRGAFIERGTVMFEGQDVLALPWEQIREIRGMKIAYVPQDPGAALNPAIRIGRQIVELLELRDIGTAEERLEGARAGLREVGLPDDDEFLARYPHQLSGGQVQRVALAMAFLPRPKVLVLDEPTTGLDVTTQGMVLQTMGELCRSHRVAALYVTHDLAVVANIADRVAVMYAGQIIELGPREAMFRQPAHPYTRALLDAIPHLSQARALTGIPGSTPGPGRRPTACRFNTRCEYVEERCREVEPDDVQVGPDHTAKCLRVGEIGTWDINRGNTTDADPHISRDIILTLDDLKVFYGRKEVVHGVSFDVAKAEVVALVGESGSGKTTIARCVGGLHKQWSGELTFEGRPLGKGARVRSAEDRKRIQYIFQNPYLSLNPRLTIQQIVSRPMELFGIAKGRAVRDRVVELLDAVALGPTVLDLQTNRLSGGERQRVAIARALAAEPDLLVCDEITSALDVSVQGSIVALLDDLRKTRQISMLFVTHNLALVRSIAARVEVLNAGALVESGFVVEVLDTPKEEYTKRLLSASPAVD